jgi:hypothetical protein
VAFPEPVPGLVIRYSYLWAEEHRRGQEEGVKTLLAGGFKIEMPIGLACDGFTTTTFERVKAGSRSIAGLKPSSEKLELLNALKASGPNAKRHRLATR